MRPKRLVVRGHTARELKASTIQARGMERCDLVTEALDLLATLIFGCGLCVGRTGHQRRQ